MKKLLFICCLLSAQFGFSQPTAELTPQGFASVEIPKPNKPEDKIVETVRNWVADYNKNNDYGYDIYDVTDTSLKIDSQKENAFFYSNHGENYFHRIKYTLKVDILESNFKVTFSVKEVYTKKTLTEITVADFFTPDGKLKEDYLDAKPSLEKTANGILKSFYDYMADTN
jgi:hypothetical protein